ncbi:hypothetical protein E3P86_03349 [Wallemia ichthyophaga]|uniref:SRP9 domain-containing protein n=1 Tax=Wallemia ichthyophaga TaxID=245174 RepID=A0A4T0IN83_WALIC|nr:hypothetical protein E3P86_03349 [Wallemia ichthyophaga]
MVNVKSWKEYQKRSIELFSDNPKKYRYCVKWRAAKKDLVVKSTNDHLCLKYKTQSASILNRFLSFNRKLGFLMSDTEDFQIQQPESQPQSQPQSQSQSQSRPPQLNPHSPSDSPSTKNKKKNKKKK